MRCSMKIKLLKKIKHEIKKQYPNYSEEKIDEIMYGVEVIYLTITKTIIIFLIAFIGLTIAQETGYYENRLSNQTKITAEAINKFEKDVEDGKDVSIDDYLEKTAVDYSTPVSKLGNKFSENVEKFMNEGITTIFKVFGKLFS